MKNLFQRETVNEAISLTRQFQPTSAMLEFRACLSPEETSLCGEIIQDRCSFCG
jgi:hypothetical protein